MFKILAKPLTYGTFFLFSISSLPSFAIDAEVNHSKLTLEETNPRHHESGLASNCDALVSEAEKASINLTSYWNDLSSAEKNYHLYTLSNAIKKPEAETCLNSKQGLRRLACTLLQNNSDMTITKGLITIQDGNVKFTSRIRNTTELSPGWSIFVDGEIIGGIFSDKTTGNFSQVHISPPVKGFWSPSVGPAKVLDFSKESESGGESSFFEKCVGKYSHPSRIVRQTENAVTLLKENGADIQNEYNYGFYDGGRTMSSIQFNKASKPLASHTGLAKIKSEKKGLMLESTTSLILPISAEIREIKVPKKDFQNATEYKSVQNFNGNSQTFELGSRAIPISTWYANKKVSCTKPGYCTKYDHGKGKFVTGFHYNCPGHREAQYRYEDFWIKKQFVANSSVTIDTAPAFQQIESLVAYVTNCD
jgi:hypothetical protein